MGAKMLQGRSTGVLLKLIGTFGENQKEKVCRNTFFLLSQSFITATGFVSGDRMGRDGLVYSRGFDPRDTGKHFLFLLHHILLS